MTKKEQKARYYQNHKEEIKQKVNEYRLAHKDKISEQKYKRKKERLKTDKVFYLKNKMNNLIYYSFKRKRVYRPTSEATKIFGCSWKQFYNHLLNTFEKNYGYKYNDTIVVEVDHIIPMCRATTEEDVIKLNHISNLQLLTKEDNKKKYIY